MGWKCFGSQGPTEQTLKHQRKQSAELPPHLADMAEFTLETRLRMSNVTELKWDRVDLENR